MKQILVRTSILIAFGAIAFACGSSETKANGTGTGGGDNGSGNGGASGSTGDGTGGGSQGGSSSGGASNGGVANNDCDKTACTGKKVFGQALDACCVSADACGVTSTQLGGQCLPVSAIANLPSDLPDGGFPLPQSETIVPDPACPDVQGGGGFGGPMGGGDAGTLKGCCDKTNVCGFAVDSAQLNLTLCLTVDDIRSLGATFGGAVPAFDAGPQTPCTYPTK